MQIINYENVGETIFTEVLENGLRVYLLPRREVSNTFAIFTTNFGANDLIFKPFDKSEKITSPTGVAHFLEHKLFDKGDHDVFSEFGKLGASANAYTTPTQTSYFFSATEKVEELVELLLDFTQEPYFSNETVEKEKGIITQEAQMYADQPGERLYMKTLQALFKNHPIKNPVLGTIEDINRITKEDLNACYNAFYHPSNTSICVSGNFEVEEMMNLIKDNQAKKPFEMRKPIERGNASEPREAVQAETKITMSTSTPTCMFGIKDYAQKIGTNNLLEQTLLSNMVLGHLFSRSGLFFKQLYEEGLADYSFSYENVSEQDFGYTLLSGNTNNPNSFITRMKELLLSTQTLELSEEAFAQMKKRRIGSLLRQMNSIEMIAQEYVWHKERGLSYFELIPAIQNLTLQQVNYFIRNWVEEDRIAVCTLMNDE